MFNPAVPWSDEVVLECVARHAGCVSRYPFRHDEHCLPWSEALVSDPRFAHLFCPEDRILYERFFAPITTGRLASDVLQRRLVLDAEAALERARGLSLTDGADPLSHPIAEALGIRAPVERLLAAARDARPMLREAAARLGVSARSR